MTAYSRRALFWAPRALCLALTVFVSAFALDVFGEGHGFWQTLAALIMHLIPTFVILAVLAVAWRREWVGAVGFTAVGIFFVIVVRPTWLNKAIFAVPSFVMAGLFLVNWLKRAELHTRP